MQDASVVASVALDVDANMAAIATAAGNADLNARWYADGRLYVRGVTQEALDAAAKTVGTAPPEPPPPRLIAKTRIYRRATDAEIDKALDFLDTHATRRMRLMWNDAENGQVLVSEVRPIFATLFGEARADELLAE